MESFFNILMYGIVGIAGIAFVFFAIIAIISMAFWSYMIFKDAFLEETEKKEELRKESIDWEQELEDLSGDLKKISKEHGI